MWASSRRVFYLYFLVPPLGLEPRTCGLKVCLT